MKLKDKTRIILATTAFSRERTVLSRRLLNKIFSSNMSTLRSALSRLGNRGDIEKIISPTGVDYRLTKQGKEKIREDYPYFNYLEDKEEENYFLLFHFPERLRSYRDRLRAVIRDENWLRVTTSVYFSPFPLSNFLRSILRDKRWSERVVLLKGELLVGSLTSLLKAQVDFDQMYAQIITFISQADGVIRLIQKENSLVNWGKLARETLDRFYQLVENKPYLPEQFWQPENLPRQAWGRFLKIIQSLEQFTLKGEELGAWISELGKK